MIDNKSMAKINPKQYQKNKAYGELELIFPTKEYKKEQLTHIMKCHDAVQFPYLYNDILFFIYFLKCAVWFFNRTRFIILK